MISQKYTDIESINIRSSANVTIYKSDAFQVKIAGDDAAKVKVNQVGVELAIEYEGNSNDGNYYAAFNNMNAGGSVSIGNIRQNNTVISGGGNIFSGVSNATIYTSSGKQIRIVGGEVFVNGVLVEVPDAVSNETKFNPVEIEIWCPDGLAIDCTLDGMAVLNAAPQFNRARVVIAGSCSARLQAKSAKFNVSGSGKIEHKSLGGTSKINVSGSGDITSDGEFNDVEISVSGSGKVKTSGTVNGDYEVDVSGKGNVTHRGTVAGQKNKSISGMGSVNW